MKVCRKNYAIPSVSSSEEPWKPSEAADRALFFCVGRAFVVQILPTDIDFEEPLMDMLELARTRYTCKHYDPTRGIAPETLGRLAEILRLSASSVNIQPWRFVFLATPKAKARLMPAVKDFNLERVEHAPLIILFLAKNRLDEEHLKKLFAKETEDGRYDSAADIEKLYAFRKAAVDAYCRTPESTRLWTHEQVMLAMGSFLTSAAGMGLDATCLGGLVMEEVDRIFDFEKEGFHTVVGVSVGYRASDDRNASRPKSRFALNDVVTVL